MSTASMTFGRSTTYGIPRGSRWFANAAAALIQLLRRIDRWQLERSSRRDPRSTAEVLAWARSIEASDPGFAADLRAAVYRAESQTER
ncbi:MAG: hypothetical protein L6Q73_04630 [Aquabacterium sp.]|jgi:hypothetical protein|nr:hypothetical protein [Aquabacterium sp.]